MPAEKWESRLTQCSANPSAQNDRCNSILLRPCNSANRAPQTASRTCLARFPHLFHIRPRRKQAEKVEIVPGTTSSLRHQPFNVSVSLLRSRFRSLSDWRCSSILSTECITVVWCFPPNCLPISGRDASVICLARYMAICRGKTIARELLLALISATRSR
jgi:hypothetical protein